MSIIQIEITNACQHQCSNCTRFCGHHRQPFFMDFETFAQAVKSLEKYEGMVGIMGGEPTLHPDFERIALYFSQKRPTTPFKKLLEPVKDFAIFRNARLSQVIGHKRGLWTSLGSKYYQHFELIQDVFPYQCVNDHKNEGLHQALMIPRKELRIPDDRWYPLRDKCWVQNLWSASITPKGAFFCEVAAALDQLWDGPGGWPIEPGWWKRTPADFGNQLDWCEYCSAPLPVPRLRAEDETDLVSASIFEKLEIIGSPKRRNGRVIIFDTKNYDPEKYKGNYAGDLEWYLPQGDNSKRIASTNLSLNPRKFAFFRNGGADEPEGSCDSALDVGSFESLGFEDWCLVAAKSIKVSKDLTARLRSTVLNPGCLYIYYPAENGLVRWADENPAGSLLVCFNRRASALRGLTSIDQELRFTSRWSEEKIIRMGHDFDSPEFNDDAIKYSKKSEFMAAHLLAFWEALTSTQARVAIYGAGRHSKFLLKQIRKAGLKEPCMVVDDSPREDDLFGLEVKQAALAPSSAFDLMIISSDIYGRVMKEKAKALWPDKIIIDPYAHFSDPAFDKNEL
ncbi:MAG: radical SAM protein [Deltaproteobacteria bacterium]|nr:radical SAM protein [Deltaproteobacteria bacterium]